MARLLCYSVENGTRARDGPRTCFFSRLDPFKGGMFPAPFRRKKLGFRGLAVRAGCRPVMRMNPPTKIIAHRGNASGAPENTLEAFRHAVDIGAHGVELDVQLARDGVPVVIHDETLERTTDGTGAVAAHSAAEITALSAGLWFDPPFPRARVSTLDAVLEALAPTGLEIHLELKTANHPYPGLAEAVAELVRRRALADRVMISSFNHHTLLEVKRCAPELPLAALLYGRMIAPWDYALLHGFQGLHPEYRSVDADLAGNCRERGLSLRAYTVDDPEAARRLMALGLDGIMTNVPERMLSLQRGL